MEEKIIEILKGINGKIDYANSTDLIDGEKLNSFDVISLIDELSDEYGVDITVNDMLPENFNSVSAIAALITRLKTRI
ncbi:MAG: acyl carrier protein [Clostridia bacterium]|nr:acyl carrier protein [Clostridia bacterium]